MRAYNSKLVSEWVSYITTAFTQLDSYNSYLESRTGLFFFQIISLNARRFYRRNVFCTQLPRFIDIYNIINNYCFVDVVFCVLLLDIFVR